MAEATMTVTYDGPALVDGRMEVRDLAPALLALAELVRDANGVVNPGAPPVTLEVRATEPGSFTLQLTLTQGKAVLDAARDLLAGDPATALANLQVLVFGPLGLMWLLKRLNRRRIVEVQEEDVTPAGQITLILDDQTIMVIPRQTLDLYRVPAIRKQVRDVVAPVERDGIDEVRVEAPEVQAQVTVSKSEVRAFDPPEPVEEELIQDRYEWNLQIVNVAFVDGNKWRFSDGDMTFYAAVEDEDFIDRVDRGEETFAKGDVLRCRVRLRQLMVDGRLVAERAVEEVLEHRRFAPPPDLFGGTTE